VAPRPCDVLVTYLVALGLVDRGEDGRLVATPAAASLLRSGSPTDLGPYFASLRERPVCGELLRVLRTGEPSAWASAGRDDDWAGRLGDPEFARRITAAMDARGAVLAPALAGVLADLRWTSALDIGGGSGVYARALVEDRDERRAAVLERPPVDDAARTILRDLGEDRVDVVTGDMFAEPLPAGFDLHLLSHVLHDWDERRVRHLLAASYAALPPAAGWSITTRTSTPRSLDRWQWPSTRSSSCIQPRGKCWSTGELRAMLTETGFTVHDRRPTVADRAALIARKPH
jgi:3-hydroxy-5-methyl-1-naphthoate 3-O-methyltransferase